MSKKSRKVLKPWVASTIDIAFGLMLWVLALAPFCLMMWAYKVNLVSWL